MLLLLDSFAGRIHSMISLGLSLDEEETPVEAEGEDDAPPPLEPASVSAMEEVD